jgi:hypothetical protein
VRQKSVLLRLIETVDFVDEKYSLHAETLIGPGQFDNPIYIRLTASYGANLNELSTGFMSNNSRQSGFAATWWTPEDKTRRLFTLDDLSDNLALAY